MHICVFEKYMFPAIKLGESKSIQAAFSDSEDVRKYLKRALKAVLDSNEARDEKQRLPLEFNICYDDIDGNSLYQTFRLVDYDGVKYYALKCKEVVSTARDRGMVVAENNQRDKVNLTEISNEFYKGGNGMKEYTERQKK